MNNMDRKNYILNNNHLVPLDFSINDNNTNYRLLFNYKVIIHLIIGLILDRTFLSITQVEKLNVAIKDIVITNIIYINFKLMENSINLLHGRILPKLFLIEENVTFIKK